MIKVNVHNKVDGSKYEARFESQELADIWIQECVDTDAWGKAEHSVDDVLIPCEYEITQSDISNEIEQSEINADARAYLKKTDWYVIRALEDESKPVPQDIKDARAAARDSIVD